MSLHAKQKDGEPRKRFPACKVLFHDFRTVAHEHRRCLCAARDALRIERERAHAAYHSAAARPLNGGHGVGADARRIIEIEDVRILAHAHVVALELRVAVQNRRELLAGDGVVRAESLVAVAR